MLLEACCILAASETCAQSPPLSATPTSPGLSHLKSRRLPTLPTRGRASPGRTVSGWICAVSARLLPPCGGDGRQARGVFLPYVIALPSCGRCHEVTEGHLLARKLLRPRQRRGGMTARALVAHDNIQQRRPFRLRRRPRAAADIAGRHRRIVAFTVPGWNGTAGGDWRLQLLSR